MHVCHFCDTSVEGSYFENTVKGLTEKDVRVSLVELGQYHPPKWLADVPNTSYFCLDATSKLQYAMAMWRLVELMKQEDVDILHTHLFFAGLIGVLSKRFNRRIIVALMRHHTSVVRMLGSRLHVAADKWMAAKADRVMTVSQAAKRYMLDVDKIGRDDIEVVYLGFDFEKLSPDAVSRKLVRDEFSFAEGDLVIGYIANFTSGKGHVHLIEAFGNILEDIPHARLFFAGRGTSPAVQAAAAKLPEGKIVFAGWRDDIPACLSAMDIFVQPSLSEAFSQVLIEAMGTGLPVIATDVGGAREVIENGVNGILIEPGDPDAIYREVCALYRDGPFTKTIAEEGMLSVRQNFRVDEMAERQFTLYKTWMSLD